MIDFSDIRAFYGRMTGTLTTSSAVESPSRPLTGIDHLELWVGNARAFAHFLMAGFGFDCVAYGGPETGMDTVGYVLSQGDVRLVVTAGLNSADEVTDHVRRHGDGVRT
ncbi:MAG: VOC family protein, partial [Nitrososphaerales archaeon]